MQLLLLFAVVLVVLDSVWLFGASSMHQRMVKAVQGSPLKAKLGWAAGFYALAVLAFQQIILPLSRGSATLQSAMPDTGKLVYYGALMGLLMYGTFDLTNKAIFTNYPTDYAVYDTLWGTFAIAAASVVTVMLAKKYNLKLE
jgi:uncharacterized membrane protein